MKRLLLLIILVGLSQMLIAQTGEVTTFILVRHAEKASDGTKDPPLNAIGQKRAYTLYETLSDTKIDKIISTPLKRTRATMKHVALNSKLEIETYDYRNEMLLQELINENAGKTILISGHSNTTPFLVNRLIGEQKFDQLDDDEYDKIFIVSCTKVGDGKLVVIKY